ncbi:MAG: hypothetical protein IAE80_01045 [Anaerolinea sp.]|nr:hypothetical protein [Anaerolinea sp.]
MRGLFAALLIAAALIAAWGLRAEEAWDDAYITYQYAKHAADGAGIVYFPGDPPSQGSTTMLFTLLIAGALRLGMEAESAAFALNTGGVALIVTAAYLLGGQVTRRPFWRGLIAVLPALMPFVIFHQASGMETNFWTGLTLLTAALLASAPRTRGRVSLFAALGFLLCLTRPDSAVFVGVWWLLLLIENRRQNFPLFALFTAAGLLYVLGLRAYFGDFLPNAFYVKVGSTDGVGYGFAFARTFLISPLVLWGMWTLRRSPVLRWTAPLFMLILFYTVSSPLVGMGFRFFHPLTCVCALYAACGVVRLAEHPPALIRRRALGLRGAQIAGVALLLWVIAYPTVGVFQERAPISPLALRAWGHALAVVRPPISVAYGDAGMLPYFSGQRLIDFVGLAEPVIAREGSIRGADWIIDYVLDQQPELIGLYVDSAGQVTDGGHGVVGTAYSRLSARAAFQADYVHIGTLDYGWGYCAWFARADSPALTALQAAIHPLSVR